MGQMMTYNWFLLPAIVLALGLITRKFPPKEISRVYGYRTKRSMINQETWDFANEFISFLMIRLGVVELIFSALMWFLYKDDPSILFLVLIIESTSIIVSTVITEIVLRKNFDKNGMRIIKRK